MSSPKIPRRLVASEDSGATTEAVPETKKATQKLNELERRLFEAALGEMPVEERKLFDADLALEILMRRRPGKWAEVKNRGSGKPPAPNGQGARLVEEYIRRQAQQEKKDGKAK